jgi:lysozyme family protein
MSNFDLAVEFVLRHEGGLVHNPHDPGGTTNFGISQRAYPEVDIGNLTRDEAKEI